MNIHVNDSENAELCITSIDFSNTNRLDCALPQFLYFCDGQFLCRLRARRQGDSHFEIYSVYRFALVVNQISECMSARVRVSYILF